MTYLMPYLSFFALDHRKTVPPSNQRMLGRTESVQTQKVVQCICNILSGIQYKITFLGGVWININLPLNFLPIHSTVLNIFIQIVW